MQILQLCLPHQQHIKYDNLGDDLCALSVQKFLHDTFKHVTITTVNWLEIKEKGLDEKIHHINNEYDLFVIGAGGFIGYNIVTSTFRHADSWSKLTVPIIFLGVGIIKNHPIPKNAFKELNFYALCNNEKVVEEYPIMQNYIAAIQNASLITVRDIITQHIVEKLKSKKTKVFLSGCMTHYIPELIGTPTSKKYLVGLNIPIGHGHLCAHYGQKLNEIAIMVARAVPSSVFICHSQRELENAQQLIQNSKLSSEAFYPKTFEEVGHLYAQCETTIVTKLHAALFSLQNIVPFAMISYDMKCDSLMQMIYDHPALLTISLCDIEHLNLVSKLNAVINILLNKKIETKASIEALLSMFKVTRIEVKKALISLMDENQL